MRIGMVNWSQRVAGGAETYLEGIIPELLRRGHEVGFLSESDEPGDRERIRLPDGMRAWCISQIGFEKALAALSEWGPDVINLHGGSEQLETALLRIAPVVFFAHSYYGTCISGAKTHKYPVVSPCNRQFGWQCLLHYYPHQCGGLSPLTMLREYRKQSARLRTIPRYQAVVTNSAHMRSEFIKHGALPERVHVNPLPTRSGPSKPLPLVQIQDTVGPRALDHVETPWNLLFLGRMDLLKGGRVLLDALPLIRKALERPVQVVFAGDGPDRAAWEALAARVQGEDENLCIKFVGWVDEARRDLLLSQCDLIVVPSLWPEPFGLVGSEAGLHGVPAAAFAVGGIPDWLIPGRNGYLAPGNPPTASGLAEAIVRCLRDPAAHSRLRRGALEMAQRFTHDAHIRRLLDTFQAAVQGVSSGRQQS